MNDFRSKNKSLHLFRKYFNKLTKTSSFTIFETEVGVKYKHGTYNSISFNDNITTILPFIDTCPSFDCLILNPDLLRNKYSLCGTPISMSPHFRLMEDLENGWLTPESEYISRCKKGIIDARIPFSPDINNLINKHQYQKDKLSINGSLTISVIKVRFNDKNQFVIADGKHRAALIVYLNRPEDLILNLLSNEFVEDYFFTELFAYILKLNQEEYSINQSMIRAILHES